MLAQGRQRWINIKPALGRCLVLADYQQSGESEFFSDFWICLTWQYPLITSVLGINTAINWSKPGCACISMILYNMKNPWRHSIRVRHTQLPSVAILPWFWRKRLKAIFIIGARSARPDARICISSVINLLVPLSFHIKQYSRLHSLSATARTTLMASDLYWQLTEPLSQGDVSSG